MDFKDRRVQALVGASVVGAIPWLAVASIGALMLYLGTFAYASYRIWKADDRPQPIITLHTGVAILVVGVLFVIGKVAITGDRQEAALLETIIQLTGYFVIWVGIYQGARTRHAASAFVDVIDSLVSAVVPVTIYLGLALPQIGADNDMAMKVGDYGLSIVIAALVPTMFLLSYGGGKRCAGAMWAFAAGCLTCLLIALGIIGQQSDAAWYPHMVRVFPIPFLLYAFAVSDASLTELFTPGTRVQHYRWRVYGLAGVGTLAWLIYAQDLVAFIGTCAVVVLMVYRLVVANISTTRLAVLGKVHSELAEALAGTDTVEESLEAGAAACRKLLPEGVEVSVSASQRQVSCVLNFDQSVVYSDTGTTYITTEGALKSYQVVAFEQIANVVDFAVGSVENRVERTVKSVQEGVAKQIKIDPVTQLPNQRDFDQVESFDGKAIVVFEFSDVDRLSESEGRAAGHALFRLFTQRLSAVTRDDDKLWRADGAKLILVADLDEDDPLSWIETKRRVAAAHVELGNRSIAPEVYAGAFFTARSLAAASCLLRAEMALGSARERFNNGGTVEFDAKIEQQMSRRWKIESGFSVALRNPKRGGFSVAYQPIVDAVTTEVTAVEALARWQHPELGNISPAEFIPAAERAGLVAAIDNYVLSTVLADIENLLAAQPGLKVHVNMSPTAMSPQSIVDAVNSVMLARGQDSDGQIVFEIIESALGKHPLGELEGAMRYARDFGIGISIDDFGTGESNFDRLNRLPFTQIKLANEFVHTEDALLIESMIRTVHDLRLESVVEGVETPEQFELAKKAGADAIQGWLFAKAAPIDETVRYILNRRAEKNVDASQPIQI